MPRPRRTALPSHASLSLRDGRQLGYSEIGRASGRAVLYLHGNPGSRLEMLRPDYVTAIEQAGLRVIAVDRPGYGDSDAPAEPGHLPFVMDVRELMDGLRLRQAVATAHSRGTLPAIGLGVRLADRIRAVGVFGPTGLPDDPALLRAQAPQARLMLGLVKTAPAAARALFRLNGWIDARFPERAAQRMSRFISSPADRRQLRQRGPELIAVLAQGLRRNPGFAIDDWRSWLVDPLGFEPTDIQVPLLLWTGAEDGLCPPRLVHRMADRIETATLRELPGVGHFHSPELLVALMQATIEASRQPP